MILNLITFLKNSYFSIVLALGNQLLMFAEDWGRNKIRAISCSQFPSSDHFAVDISWHHQCLWGLPRTWNVYTSTVEEKLSVLRVSNGWDFLSLLFSEKISCVILQLISIKTKLGKCNYKVLWHSIDLFSTEKIVFF